ncbi:cell filamentation protein Fic [Rhodanobacter panaciterrae]|uniref:Cell filamentation protein Fic n=1 Tax=Rhodanobacter panaciterrae TaxID=490572 RepID=A0ABQ2ZNW3_9GAMM|nr:Fic family protein [Rhodanobacter panaciterrae]GGY21311.1 cell filamentation protein Fic [Rhodanobacter panaciterrae]
MPHRYQPPFQISTTALNLVAQISELLGRWSVSADAALAPQLRRDNRIRTIQASLAIENNSLSLEQVTAVLDGKRVLGQPREIQEVRNAFVAYEHMADWQPGSRNDLLSAHGLLMAGLMDAPGRIRRGDVGIYRGDQLVHMAPPASRVGTLVDQLLGWLDRTDTHPLIASCVFHYEFEFIHPFADGNGRMGRLWQTLMLGRWQPMLAYLPVETVIRSQQQDYYAALAASDKASDATSFVEFMLRALHAAMTEAVLTGAPDQVSGKMSGKVSGKILAVVRSNPDITIPELAKLAGVSSRTIERNLQKLQGEGLLRRVGPAKGGHWELC